jgi:hypothetical protein
MHVLPTLGELFGRMRVTTVDAGLGAMVVEPQAALANDPVWIEIRRPRRERRADHAPRRGAFVCCLSFAYARTVDNHARGESR